LHTEPLLSAHHWRQAGNAERAWKLELETAKTQLERGLLQSGLTLLEKIIEEASKEHPLRLEALVLAGNYLFLQDTGRTEAYLNEVLHAPGLEPRLKLRALLALVNNAVYQGDMTKAQQVIAEAEALASANLAPSLRLELEHHRLEVMLRSGEFAKADAHLPNVYALGEDNIDTQSYEAQLRFYQARFVEAAARFERMRAQDPDCVRRLTLENDLGACYWTLGKLAEAEKETQRSLETWRGSPHVEALSTMYLAFVRLSQGRIRAALELAEKAIDYSLTVGSLTFEADARQCLGVIYFQCGQFAKAKESLEVAAKQLREVGDPFRQARSLNTLSGIYALLGDSAAAENSLQMAETLFKIIPNPLISMFTAHAKALLALQQKDFATAKHFLIMAETLARDNQFSEFLCVTLLDRARLERHPQSFLNEALELAIGRGFRLQEYRIRMQLGDEGAGKVLEYLRANAPEGWF
jgi:tetratricopeptide (TPR) repeat protein